MTGWHGAAAGVAGRNGLFHTRKVEKSPRATYAEREAQFQKGWHIQTTQACLRTVTPIHHILEGLSANTRPDFAWKEFLKLYSPGMLRVIGRYEHEETNISDCFVFVCAKLSDNDFRRLLSFRPDTGARFRTWLSTVVANLCVDWRRRQHGHMRPIKAIKVLPERDRAVVRCLYELGMTRQECLYALRCAFPEMTDQDISEINARVYSILSSKQRWKLSVRAQRPLSLDATGQEPRDPGRSPDESVEHQQRSKRVHEALMQLSSRQRLLLRLRYQQDLTLAEVARLVGLRDTNHAHREIQRALAAMAKIFRRREHEFSK